MPITLHIKPFRLFSIDRSGTITPLKGLKPPPNSASIKSQCNTPTWDDRSLKNAIIRQKTRESINPNIWSNLCRTSFHSYILDACKKLQESEDINRVSNANDRGLLFSRTIKRAKKSDLPYYFNYYLDTLRNGISPLEETINLAQNLIDLGIRNTKNLHSILENHKAEILDFLTEKNQTDTFKKGIKNYINSLDNTPQDYRTANSSSTLIYQTLFNDTSPISYKTETVILL